MRNRQNSMTLKGEKSSVLGNGIGYSLFLVASAVAFVAINNRVTEPYIDEFFHVPQCKKYCDYKFHEWDNKITTPPGLYILGFIYSKILDLANMTGDSCGLTALRSLNFVGGVIIFPMVLKNVHSLNTHHFSISSLIACPLLAIYYSLFYTDVWSTILITWCLAIAVTLPMGTVVSSYLSAFIGLVSLWFRQTNIVWIGFVLTVLIDRRVQVTNKNASKLNIFQQILLFIKQILSDWTLVLPYIVDIVLFAVFLVVNGGITFGDKDNHVAGLHVVQVFYCFSFICFLSWPIWLSFGIIKRYLKFTFGSLVRLVFTLSLFAVINYIIENFTVVHPFLLADNRHYTFYIWRKIISHSHSKVILIPIYHFASFVIIHNLYRTSQQGGASAKTESKLPLRLSMITILAFFFCLFATIIPSPLFEPRYYIIPYIFFRLFNQPTKEPLFSSRTTRLGLEYLWNNLINLVIVYVFLNFEFEWTNEPGVIQRIIW